MKSPSEVKPKHLDGQCCTRCGRLNGFDVCAACLAQDYRLKWEGRRTMTYEETLAEWQETAVALKALAAKEKALREGLFNGTFPKPVEGTNTFELPDGRKVKGVHKITRTLDVDVLTKLVQDETVPAEVASAVTRWKAELKLKEYKELDAAVKKLVDKAIKSKPGLPSLEIVAAPQQAVEVSAPE